MIVINSLKHFSLTESQYFVHPVAILTSHSVSFDSEKSELQPELNLAYCLTSGVFPAVNIEPPVI